MRKIFQTNCNICSQTPGVDSIAVSLFTNIRELGDGEDIQPGGQLDPRLQDVPHLTQVLSVTKNIIPPICPTQHNPCQMSKFLTSDRKKRRGIRRTELAQFYVGIGFYRRRSKLGGSLYFDLYSMITNQMEVKIYHQLVSALTKVQSAHEEKKIYSGSSHPPFYIFLEM